MRSTAHLFPRLLDNLRVMLYQGYPLLYPADKDNMTFVMESLHSRNGYCLYHGKGWLRSTMQLGRFGMVAMV
jgi:hypothetical protein